MIDLREHGIGVGSSNIKSIQRGIITSTVASVDISISSVDINSSILKISVFGRSPSGGPVDNYGMAQFIDNSTIRISRGGTTTEIDYAWEVIEFKNVKSIQRGLITLATINKTLFDISKINVNKSILFASFQSYSTSVNEYGGVMYAIENDSQISARAYSTSTQYRTEMYWQLIEFN